eukprot:m.156979 g.156979  ORF g.156979 m.156979 type:complete len:1566 (+) comp17569_c0_seq8:231-4928(+)
MEDYVIYGEIGSGSASSVYKGRKSGTLLFLALQSFEKENGAKPRRKQKMSNLVAHPNIVPVVKYCETDAEHWVCMEYCPGGDLLTILSQDKRLPEPMCRQFGLDVAQALQHVHGRGLVLRDLRPSKLLLDQGHLRLADLSSALVLQQRSSHADAAAAAAAAQGALLYSAPELLSQDGAEMFSLASDFWALGCILYEMYSGSPPFYANTPGAAAQAVMNAPLPLEPLAGASPEYVDLVQGLLEKEPTQRFSWKELAEHSAWNGQLAAKPMHTVDAHFKRLFWGGATIRPTTTIASTFADFPEERDSLEDDEEGVDSSDIVMSSDTVQDSPRSVETDSLSSEDDGQHRLPLSPDNIGINRLRQRTFTVQNLKAVSGSQDGTPQLGTDPFPVPEANTTSDADGTSDDSLGPAPPPAAAAQRTVRSERPSKKRSIQRRPSKLPVPVKYTGSSPRTPGSSREYRTERASVQGVGRRGITDDGLSHSDHRDDDDGGGHNGDDRHSHRQRPPRRRKTKGTVAKGSAPGKPSDSVAATSAAVASSADASSCTDDGSARNTNRKRRNVRRPQTVATTGGDARPSSPMAASSPRPVKTAPLHKQRTVEHLLAAHDPTLMEKYCHQSLDLHELLVHDSDVAVSPIVGNPKIEKSEALSFDARALGFASLHTERWLQLDGAQLSEHIETIADALAIDQWAATSKRSSSTRGSSREREPSAHSQSRTRLQVLAYLHFCCSTEPEVADIVANSRIFPAMAKSFKGAPDDCRQRLAVVVGAVARHATAIADSVPMGEIAAALADALRDNFRNKVLKRKLAAAIGETLFYISSQPLSELPTQSLWKVSSSVYSILLRCLRHDEDWRVQAYAVKAIENVATIQGPHAKPFATNEVALSLWTVLLHSKNSALQASCGSALWRLSNLAPTLFQHVVDKAGLDAIVDVLKSASSRVRQPFVNMMVLVFCNLADLPRMETALADCSRMVTLLMKPFESLPTVLKAKVYLLLSQVGRRNPERLLQACNTRLLHFLEHADAMESSRDKAPVAADVEYLLMCGGLLVQVLASATLETAQQTKTLLDSVAGRRHPSAAQARALKGALGVWGLVLFTVTSPLTRPLVVTSGLVEALAGVIAHLPQITQGETNLDDAGSAAALTQSTFAAVETIAQQPPSRELQRLCFAELLPVLVGLLDSTDCDNRLTSLRLVAVLLARSEHPADDLVLRQHPGSGSSHGQPGASSPRLVAFTGWFCGKVVPLLEAAFVDPQLTPEASYAARVLLAAVSIDANILPLVVASPQLTENIVAAFHPPTLVAPDTNPGETSTTQPELAVDSPHLVQLVQAVVCSPAFDVLAACQQLQLSQRIAGAVAAAATLRGDNDGPLVLSLLQVAYHLVHEVADGVRLALNVKRHQSQDQLSQNRQVLDKAEELLRQIEPLMPCVEPMSVFVTSPDSQIALHAGRCLALLLQLHTVGYARLGSARVLSRFAHAVSHGGDASLRKLIFKVIQRGLTAHPALADKVRQHPGFSQAVLAAAKQGGGQAGDGDAIAGDASFLDASLNASVAKVSFNELGIASLASTVAQVCGLSP